VYLGNHSDGQYNYFKRQLIYIEEKAKAERAQPKARTRKAQRQQRGKAQRQKSKAYKQEGGHA